MSAQITHTPGAGRGRRADEGERWLSLCARHLPFAPAGSIWRFSRAAAPGDPTQGWKLHLSVTVLTACRALEAVAPLLQARGVQFKAPASLLEINRVNTGLFYGYSQIGKLITVYPRTDEEAISLAQKLYEMTRHLHGPAVPFERRFRPDGCVYYRYGAFQPLEIENADGTRTPAIRDPAGRLLPDLRDILDGKPEWVTDPFARPARGDASPPQGSPLSMTYRAFRALTQRGRGGVYEAVDFSADPPRLCVLKEGRRLGEVHLDGRDGAWRVRNEGRVIASLRAAGVTETPRIYASFTVEGNYYLVAEFIEGQTLQELLLKRRRRLALALALRLGSRLALLLDRVHDAGWAWRDFKPSNLMLTPGGDIRPLDFEGACPIDKPDPMPWGTQGYTPPVWRPRARSRVYEDLYGLGATLHLLLTGRLPESADPAAVGRLRRGVPPRVCRLIARLLTADPRRQPTARAVARDLASAL